MSNLHSSEPTPFVDGSLATVWHEGSRSFYHAWLIRPLSKQEVANEIPMDEEAPPSFGPHIHVLKGTAHRSGDGFKDETKKGQVVYVWNQQLPSPYQEGQYPRVDNSIMSASTDMYYFVPATVEEARRAIQMGEERATARDLHSLLDRFVQELAPIMRFRHVVSYNDSYFGEPAGLLKRTIAALERLSSVDSVTPTSRLLRQMREKVEEERARPKIEDYEVCADQPSPHEWKQKTHTFRAGDTLRKGDPVVLSDPSPTTFRMKLSPPPAWHFPDLKGPLTGEEILPGLQEIAAKFYGLARPIPAILKEGPFSHFRDQMAWVQWAPTEPVDYGLSKTFVQVRFRAGGSAIGQAREFEWSHHPSENGGDIVAFRNVNAPAGYVPPGYPD